MSRQRRRDTAAELAVRRELFGRGLRYRVHRRPVPELRRQADIVFSKRRVAVFVDGCFWHDCPEHGVRPSVNEAHWCSKLEANKSRDRDTDMRLEQTGWRVVRLGARTAFEGCRRCGASSGRQTVLTPQGGVESYGNEDGVLRRRQEGRPRFE
jgi:DNA mismatch endonuclease (patch repair protein)